MVDVACQTPEIFPASAVDPRSICRDRDCVRNRSPWGFFDQWPPKTFDAQDWFYGAYRIHSRIGFTVDSGLKFDKIKRTHKQDQHRLWETLPQKKPSTDSDNVDARIQRGVKRGRIASIEQTI